MAEAWIDRHGDVWTLGDDGLLHTPETAPFPREHVERKWGPLVLVEQTPPLPDPRAEAIAVLARAGAFCGQCGREPSDPIEDCADCVEVLGRYADALLEAGVIRQLTAQYAVQEKTFLDGDYDRLDTGAGWSNRRGRRYSEAEAHARAPNARATPAGRSRPGSCAASSPNTSRWRRDLGAPMSGSERASALRDAAGRLRDRARRGFVSTSARWWLLTLAIVLVFTFLSRAVADPSAALDAWHWLVSVAGTPTGVPPG